MYKQLKNRMIWASGKSTALIASLLGIVLLYLVICCMYNRNVTQQLTAGKYSPMKDMAGYQTNKPGAVGTAATVLLVAGSLFLALRENRLRKRSAPNPNEPKEIYCKTSRSSLTCTNEIELFITGMLDALNSQKLNAADRYGILANIIADVQEKERRRIGQELHDNVNQILACSLLTISMVKDLHQEDEKRTQYLNLTQSYISHAIQEIRKLSHKMAPVSFEAHSLKTLFETLLDGINLNHQYNIQLHVDEQVHAIVSEEIQINLYRILQEQVKNMLKYSFADTLQVEVSLTPHSVIMRTADNGCGFHTSDVKQGIGLNNMKERTESFSGCFQVNSEPGKGCEILVEIPLEHAVKASGSSHS